MSKSVLKQELFVISEKSQQEGIHQDQLKLEPGTTYLRFHDRQFEVLTVTCFDCVTQIEAADVTRFKEMILANSDLVADLVCHKNLVQRLELKWIRPPSSNEVVDGPTLLKFEVLEQPICLERIQAIHAAATVLSEQASLMTSLAMIPPEFKTRIYEFKNLLEHLKLKIDKIEANIPKDSFVDAQQYRLGVAQSIAQYLEDLQIPRLYAEAAVHLKELSGEPLQKAMEFARAHVGPLVYGAPFASRAYFKPRGYAGDYEMMNHLYRNELVGQTLFDQCMHKYFVEESAGAAVKNRGYYLCNKLSELFAETPNSNSLKILSVASGPAMEQQLFLKQSQPYHGRQVEFTCLDSDEQSLKHAQRQLITAEKQIKSGFDFRFKNMAIRNVIARGLPEDGYDMIYSAGLFDYFTDQVARAAAVKFITALKPGGRVIIGNYSKDNLSASFMEVVLDWHLIYRSEQDLLRIFQGLGSKIWVEKEPLGINLFVVIEK